MRTMRFVLLVACVIAIFLLIAGCKNTKELNSEPVVPQPAAFEQRPEPVSAGADGGIDSAAAAGYLEAEAGEPGSLRMIRTQLQIPKPMGARDSCTVWLLKR
ncbi:hypothetical protein QNH46_03070 [Paenibacillus woosongensis]|uniref:Uncharacterized protein n=1 Tax=Paenibacillus woosongensis TaxID=307580 RepID=A0AA95ICH6_9BACL|nr:hypothetical protein [Paenibacillus woosongensis]WHX49683.1 hypothetical protein QNH46_03070 [Paenibacillus woosongensis]